MMLKPFTVNRHKLWKILKEMRWEYQTTLLVSWETCVWIKKQQWELGMEKWISSKLGKYFKAVNCHPSYLNCMQSTLCEIPG